MSEGMVHLLSASWRYRLFVFILTFCVEASAMQSSLERKVSGVIVDPKDAVLNGITVIARGASGERRTTTNEAGQFSVAVPDESISLRIEGQYIKPQDINLPLKAPWDALRIEAE